MKKRILNFILLIGILLIFYPIIGRFINQINQTKVISKYKENINSMSLKEKEERKIEYQKYNSGKSNLNLLKTGEVLGYISIPDINVYLPIYEGTTDEVLQQGVGHLKNTSLPIGGKNTNSVLVGHTGITAKTIFDNLIKLELQDFFYIHILNEDLKYRIFDIKKVLPNDTKNIKLFEDKEIVTLVTCTPKYVNSHRLLIMGERVKH